VRNLTVRLTYWSLNVENWLRTAPLDRARISAQRLHHDDSWMPPIRLPDPPMAQADGQ
jgi:hypothetical protein